MPRLLTIDEVAKLLCISRSLAYRLAERGAFPVHRIARRALRVSADDLQAYLDSCREQRTQTPRAALPKLKHLRI